MTIVMRPSCWHQNFGPNGLSAPYPRAMFKLLFSLISDFNISSALRWAIQDQWPSGYIFWSFGTVVFSSTLLFGNRNALNPGLGGVRCVASAIIAHEQTRTNRVCCFQTLDLIFPKDLFSDHLETTTAVVVSCGALKSLPAHRYSLVIFTFSGPFGL